MAKQTTSVAAEAGTGLNLVQETLARFLDTASVSQVYAEPVQNGPLTLIAAAEVLTILGFGTGYGSSEKDEAGGGGGGGGGRVLARPVAVIVASPDGVRIEPVVDVTKVALAGITAAGFMLATLLGMIGPRRMLRQLKGKG